MIDRVKELLAQTKLSGLLQEIQFPITKDELMTIAEEHDAPDKVIELLDRLPQGTFDSAMQVLSYLRGGESQEAEVAEDDLKEDY